MKSALALFLIPFCLFTCLAQDTTAHDPLKDAYGGHPVLANSAELILMTNNTETSGTITPWLQVMDVNGTGNLVRDDWNGSAGRPFAQGEYTDILSDDFDGDGFAEVITARILPDSGRQAPILLECWHPVRNKPGYTWQWAMRETLQTTAKFRSSVRLHAIRAIFSKKKQLALVAATDADLVVKTFAVDRGFAELGSQSLTRGNVWTVGFGDFNGDGLDDLLRCSILYWTGAGGYDTLDIETAQFNPAAGSFTRQPYRHRVPTMVISGHMTWSRIKVVAGDFHHLGHDEAVISIAQYWIGAWRQSYSYINFSPAGVPSTAPAFFNYPHTLGSISSYAFSAGWESDAIAVDLDPLRNDGDELVVVGPRGFGIVKPDTIMFPPVLYWKDTVYVSALDRGMSLRALAVGDIDPDTSDQEWIPEIIVAQHRQDASTVLRVFRPVINASNDLTGMTELPSIEAGRNTAVSALTAADLDGDAIHFGTPRLITVERFVQPIIVMSGPPTHFDNLRGQAYDLCSAYDTAQVRKFEVSYTETQGSSTHLETNISHSAGGSAEISAGVSIFGFKVAGYAKKAFEKGYYGAHSTDSTITTTTIQKSYRDDWMLGTQSNLELWEYPVYALDKKLGTYLVQMPRFVRTLWLPYMDLTLRDWMADREVGNLLSYRPNAKIASWAGPNLVATFQTKTIAQASASGFSMNFGDSTVDQTRLSHSVRAEVGLSVSTWGVEANVSGHYADDVGSTHTIKISRNVTIGVTMGDLNRAYSDANYYVTPYLYWGQNGALVLDYGVDLPVTGDTVLGTFWEKNYFTKPDPGLLLPWRLDSLKKIGGAENLKLYSKSIHVSPAAPYVGDTAHITVVVHNFSLRKTTGLVTVRCYLGDPRAGGAPLIGLGRSTPDLITSTPIEQRDQAELSMDWVVPAGLSSSARIYAFVDPDNTMGEIHEDNNIGFFALHPAGAMDVGEEPGSSVPEAFALMQNYPNPFNPSTVIRYEVPAASHVSLVIFDILGRVVATPVNGVVDAGAQHAVFNAQGLASGVYFYQIEARPLASGVSGGFTAVKKMMLLR